MDAKRIGKRLRDLRGKRSQTEIADAIHITKQGLSLYETGHRIPADEIKIRLAHYYGVTVQELFYDD